VKELLGHEHLGTLQRCAKFTITDLKKTHADVTRKVSVRRSFQLPTIPSRRE